MHESKEGETRALHVKANRPQVYSGGKEETNDRGSDVLVGGRGGGEMPPLRLTMCILREKEGGMDKKKKELFILVSYGGR